MTDLFVFMLEIALFSWSFRRKGEILTKRKDNFNQPVLVMLKIFFLFPAKEYADSCFTQEEWLSIWFFQDLK